MSEWERETQPHGLNNKIYTTTKATNWITRVRRRKWSRNGRRIKRFLHEGNKKKTFDELEEGLNITKTTTKTCFCYWEFFFLFIIISHLKNEEWLSCFSHDEKVSHSNEIEQRWHDINDLQKAFKIKNFSNYRQLSSQSVPNYKLWNYFHYFRFFIGIFKR